MQLNNDNLLKLVYNAYSMNDKLSCVAVAPPLLSGVFQITNKISKVGLSFRLRKASADAV